MLDDNLNTLLDELTSFSVPKPNEKQITSKANVPITEENIESFVLKSAETLINTSLESVTDIKDYIVQGQNPDEIESLASLINSTANAIETLNKLSIQIRKNKAAKELKTMELEAKKELNTPQINTGNTINNTNVIVASRDEIIKKYISESTPQTIEIVEQNTSVLENRNK